MALRAELEATSSGKRRKVQKQKMAPIQKIVLMLSQHQNKLDTVPRC